MSPGYVLSHLKFCIFFTEFRVYFFIFFTMKLLTISDLRNISQKNRLQTTIPSKKTELWFEADFLCEMFRRSEIVNSHMKLLKVGAY